MRLFLLPVSTRRSLIYCEKLPSTQSPASRSLLDKLTTKASETWVAWEQDSKAPLNWKKRVTTAGNQALNRIPFEEWGLKTLPALTPTRKKAILSGDEKYQVLYPGLFLPKEKVPGILERLAMEKQGTYRRKMIWSIIAMPFTAPFALVPIIPNLPFFYLVYRAYSYWKALSGSRHLAFLLKHNQPIPTPSNKLDLVYAAGLIHPTRDMAREMETPSREEAENVAREVEAQMKEGEKEVMVLRRWNGKMIAEELGLADMEVEIERAVEQVEGKIRENERKEGGKEGGEKKE